MKIKMLFVAMAVFALASISHAQFNAGMSNFGQALTTNCDGSGDPLGLECSAVIYWDANANGPDAADQPPVVGAEFGQCNFNSFPLNGADFGFPGGFFLDQELFTISTVTPQPSLYYLVVECHGVRWTSSVVTITNGVNDYAFDSGWACEVTVEPCNEPTNVRIDAPAGGQTPTPFSQCIAGIKY